MAMRCSMPSAERFSSTCLETSHVLAAIPLLLTESGKVLIGEVIGQLRHFGRVGAARVQHGPAAPVDRARVFTVERHHVAPPAVRILGVEVRQRLPAATETKDLDIVFAAAVADGLYDRV